MNKAEIGKALAILKVAYPAYYKDLTPQDVEALVNLWEVHFGNREEKELVNAIHMYIHENVSKFPPTINDLVNIMDKTYLPTMAEALDEYWSHVRRYSDAESWKELPAYMRCAVSSSEMRQDAQSKRDSFRDEQLKKAFRETLDMTEIRKEIIAEKKMQLEHKERLQIENHE